MHTKFVVKPKKDEKRQVCKHKARLVVCKKEEEDSREDNFSKVALYLLIK